jgi:hypothetical protein
VLLASVLVAYRIGRARADVPTSGALVYSGLIEQNGQPVDGSQVLAVLIFDAASEGNVLCTDAASGNPTPVSHGYFQVAMQDACVAKLQGAPAAWVEVRLGGVPITRKKLGAVPFALQADQASGALAARLTAIEARLPRSAIVSNDGTQCTVTKQWGGDWIQSVTRMQTGICMITFAPGTFASTPACAVTAGSFLLYGAQPTNTGIVTMSRALDGTWEDAPVQILCVGS